MKRLLMLLLSIVSGLFALIGILGVVTFIDGRDPYALIFFILWALFGIFLLFFFSKRARSHPSKIAEDTTHSPVKEESDPVPSVQNTAVNINQPFSNIAETSTDDANIPSITIPEKKDGVPLAYRYNHQEIFDSNFDAVLQFAKDGKYELSASANGNNTSLYIQGTLIGCLKGRRAEMLNDWIQNKEPYLIYLERIDVESQKVIVFLAFYRDKRSKMSYREQTTVKLTNFKHEDHQMVISALENGDELSLSEEYNDRTDSNYVVVEKDFVEIGRLPKKTCERYLDEGAAGCFFDHSDYDEVNDIYTPYVVIYW